MPAVSMNSTGPSGSSLHRLFHRVGGRARLFGDDGDVLPRDGVEQARLAHVAAAEEADVQPHALGASSGSWLVLLPTLRRRPAPDLVPACAREAPANLGEPSRRPLRGSVSSSKAASVSNASLRHDLAHGAPARGSAAVGHLGARSRSRAADQRGRHRGGRLHMSAAALPRRPRCPRRRCAAESCSPGPADRCSPADSRRPAAGTGSVPGCRPRTPRRWLTSWPMTSMAAWLTASGITGFTLPGMIDEPACRCGRRISPKPASGPTTGAAGRR